MFLSSSQLKHHVAATSRGRYSLNTIALTHRGAISTDGHSLLFAPYPEVDPADAPQIDGVDPGTAPPQAGPFLVSPEDAARAAAMLGRPKRFAPPVTQFLQAEIRGETMNLGATDLSNAQTMTLRQVDGVYPDVASVIPDYAAALAVTLNLDQLIRTLKALRGATSEDVVTLRLIDDQSAIGLSCKDGTCALCMPVQVDKPEEHVPDQLALLKPEAAPAGPPPAKPAAPPAAPEGDEGEDGEDLPTETEMADVQSVYQAVAATPEASTASAPPRRRRRRAKTSGKPQNELQEILSGA
ncbi:MAG: hypothetical protein KF754_00515 [Planctomycetes bacterium]|nr:hypothetical protein [Planctomycetota bacterium]